jgi:hypothetical protein
VTQWQGMIGVMTSADTFPLDAAGANALVAEFEAATVSLDRFHHRQHLAVAVWLLLHDSRDSAVQRMRRGLQNLLRANGKTEGYDDPLTVRWMDTLANRLASCAPDLTPVGRLNEVVEWATGISDTEHRGQNPAEALASSGSTEE